MCILPLNKQKIQCRKYHQVIVYIGIQTTKSNLFSVHLKSVKMPDISQQYVPIDIQSIQKFIE